MTFAFKHTKQHILDMLSILNQSSLKQTKMQFVFCAAECFRAFRLLLLSVKSTQLILLKKLHQNPPIFIFEILTKAAQIRAVQFRGNCGCLNRSMKIWRVLPWNFQTSI